MITIIHSHTRHLPNRDQFITKLMAFDLNGDGKVSKEEFLMCARLDPTILLAFGYAGDAGDMGGSTRGADETEGGQKGGADGGGDSGSRRMQQRSGGGDGGGGGSARAIQAMKSAAKREDTRAGSKRGRGCTQQ